MDELDYRSLRLEVLRTALEFGTQRDVVNPDHLFEKYWEVPGTGTTAVNGRWVPDQELNYSKQCRTR